MTTRATLCSPPIARALLALAGALAALVPAAPAGATSSAIYSASDSIGVSVGAFSRSFRDSSDGSSHGSRVSSGRAGHYRVAGITDDAEDATLKLVRFEPVEGTGATGTFALRLPMRAVEHGGLAAGTVVAAQERPYGVEYARADTRAAFFLLLDDGWSREFDSVRVL